MRRVAANYVTWNNHRLTNHVVEILDGRVVNVYPLKGEIAMAEWLAGTIEIDGDQAWHRKKSDSKLQLLK